MDKRYFTTDEFNDNFGKEMVASQNVFENMKKNKLQDYQYCEFDFNFISDSKEKLVSLGNFLQEKYQFKKIEIKKDEDLWDMWGEATPFPVDADNLLFWALDLYVKGYEFDCQLEGYGAVVETDKPEFPDLDASKADYYFDQALRAYKNQNRGLAIIHFSSAIKIDPKDPNSYYSRAVVKNELYTWKSALRDYDKAIELAPKFVDALVNRGAVKDDSGDYEGAIEDYNKVIEIKPTDPKAYFNRGNTKYNKGDKDGACSDWRKAKELGDVSADERIKKICR
jgi:tetratricopeptide (TPR) repeat protein